MKTKAMADLWLDLLRDANPHPLPATLPSWPDRSALLPSLCGALLGDMFILETRDDQARFRLAGTRICDLHGQELRGHEFGERFELAERELLQGWATDLHADEGMVLISSRGSTEAGETVPLETLLMPLSLGERDGERVAGITTPGAAPYWLGSTPIVHERLLSTRLLRPWRDSIAGDHPRRIASAPPLATPEPVAGRQVRHLRVLAGGKDRTI
ncbi:MAG: PAS domain-containing protein [Pseudomonadota bacterium]